MSVIDYLNNALGIPTAFLCLGVLLGVVVIWFVLFKRPVYEAIFISFIALVALTNTWSSIGGFIKTGLSTSLLYSMVAFVAMSIILTKTKIIDSCVAIILALLGKLPGGVGYASVIASSFMGALSGSGPGNVMATGAMTIPAMKKSGFPPELAANIESNASYMGNMIPPSSNILAALAAFHGLYGEESLTQGKFWIVLWGISLWFILQRLVMVFAFCTYYKVKPLPKEERPSLRETLKTGWQGLLLPVIILIPFLLDYFLKDNFFLNVRATAEDAQQYEIYKNYLTTRDGVGRNLVEEGSTYVVGLRGIPNYTQNIITKSGSTGHNGDLALLLSNRY